MTLPAEVDVLVIGFGAAGAAAAIAAHDAGASVLYSAGAAGSVWGHLTEHGGGLTDAIVFGRIAGAGAAARA